MLNSLLLTAFRFRIYFLASQRIKPHQLACQPTNQPSIHSTIQSQRPSYSAIYCTFLCGCLSLCFMLLFFTATLESVLMAAFQLKNNQYGGHRRRARTLTTNTNGDHVYTVDVLSSISCIHFAVSFLSFINKTKYSHHSFWFVFVTFAFSLSLFLNLLLLFSVLDRASWCKAHLSPFLCEITLENRLVIQRKIQTIIDYISVVTM